MKVWLGYLGAVGFLQLVLVMLHLAFMLVPQILKGISQLALKLPLAAIVNLHQASLMTPLALTQLLYKKSGKKTKIKTTQTFDFVVVLLLLIGAQS